MFGSFLELEHCLLVIDCDSFLNKPCVAGAWWDPALRAESWICFTGARQCLQDGMTAEGLSQTQPHPVCRQGADGSRQEGAGGGRCAGLGTAGTCGVKGRLGQVREDAAGEDSSRAGT